GCYVTVERAPLHEPVARRRGLPRATPVSPHPQERAADGGPARGPRLLPGRGGGRLDRVAAEPPAVGRAGPDRRPGRPPAGRLRPPTPRPAAVLAGRLGVRARRLLRGRAAPLARRQGPAAPGPEEA